MPATSTATPAEAATATETISGNKWRTSGIKAKGGSDTNREREERESEKRGERKGAWRGAETALHFIIAS